MPDTKRKARDQGSRIGLALAGGGPLGAIYEIGALCALEDALDGLDFTRLDHYVGVSAGGFIAAGLANGMRPRELYRAFSAGEPGEEMFDPDWLLVPAWRELFDRLRRTPQLVLGAAWRLLAGRRSLTSALEHLGQALPTGLLSGDEVQKRLADWFSRNGRTNDFGRLRARLTLVATNLDSGEAAPFGRPGFDHVPISLAVQASAALPGLFPPVEIDGRSYVDGALKKTLHASVALDDGVDLLLCLNPLVPFDAEAPQPARVMRRGLPPERRSIPRIVDGGLPAVLTQTFRAMIHSRLELGMKHYERAYPGTDIVLFEPDPRDPELYLANTFSYAQRDQLAEHAYQQTRSQLRQRRGPLGRKLARHGVRLNNAALDDRERHLAAPPPVRTRLVRAVNTLEESIDTLASTLALPRAA